MFALLAAAQAEAGSPEATIQELYDMRTKYGQQKKAIEYCSSSFTTIGEVKFCLDNLLKNVKIRRLMFIADRVPELEVEALQMAIGLVKQSRNVALYQELLEKGGDKLGEEFRLDPKWVETTTKANQKELEHIEQEFTQTKSKSIREYTRMGHNDFGQYHYNCGNLQESLRCYVRTREYCSTSKHIVDMCLNVIKVAVELGLYQHVLNYCVKAEQTTEPLDAATQAKLMVSSALAMLDTKKTKAAAAKFVAAPIELGSSFNEVVSAHDVAVYGALCALASFDRSDLRTKVVESPTFKQYLELVPEMREIVMSFYGSKYAVCLQLMEKIKGDLMLDIHLAKHVDHLYERVRNRALVQYCSPFSSVRMTTMAIAFNTTLPNLEQELARLIMEDEINARIDSHNKILYAREHDKRNAAFKGVLAMSEEYIRSTRALLLRVELVRNDYCILGSSSVPQQ